MQQRNLFLFFLISGLMILTYLQVRPYLIGKGRVQPDAPTKRAESKTREFKAVELPTTPPPTPENQLVTLGDADPDSDYNLQVVFDPRGAGVRAITLNKFKPADDNGRPAPGKVLPLVPAAANLREPSHLLLHYPPKETDTPKALPVDTLGKRIWQIEGEATSEQVAFSTVVDGVKITKTYTLQKGTYHLGLQVDLQLIDPSVKEPVKFRYQLTGTKGLPIEGKWYTHTFRNALIGLEDKQGNLARGFEDLRQISLWGGGNPVDKTEDRFIRYAGVAVQYFASVIVVDNEQSDQRFLRRANASLETGVIRGRVKAGSLAETDRVVLVSENDKTKDRTIYLPPDAPAHLRAQRAMLREGELVTVVYHTLSEDPRLGGYPMIAQEINTGMEGQATHALWEDDITVRVSTDTLHLEPGQTTTHRYLLYNGPVKPRLLRGLRGDRAVSDELIDRYSDTLKLYSLTDHHSPGWFGAFFNSIYWTPLVIKCTNLMHWVLGKLQLIIPSYGLTIILLTVLVRLLMFPLSRKQALMSIKMQALQPELKKLTERYKDDPSGKAQAQMELFRKHGVNPIGSCWVILLQMPVFMGLYFALQESIQFRLAEFWPTWIVNLAAPDMLFSWGRSIPFLSRDADYGGMFYLGPYFNLLPLFAVGLMIVQQKMLMPPPTDKEQEMQQRMMRIMMLIMGIFFFKIAAGLCIYIITSTLWGFAERKLLPKAKPVGIDTDLDKTVASLVQSPREVTPESKPEGRKPGRNKRKPERALKAKEQAPNNSLSQRLADWWQNVLEQARKK